MAEQIEFGTPGKDKIIEYGGTDNVTQYIEAAAGNDWLLQMGGDKATGQISEGVPRMIPFTSMVARVTAS